MSLVDEEGGEALAGVSARSMRQHLRGRGASGGGIASVASHPIGALAGPGAGTAGPALLQMCDEGHPLSALHPFRPSFYERFGNVGLPGPGWRGSRRPDSRIWWGWTSDLTPPHRRPGAVAGSHGGHAGGTGGVTIEVVDDEPDRRRYRLDGDQGRLVVGAGAPQATLTAAGASGLRYGVPDPVEVVVRGLGTADAGATSALRSLFPRTMPYLYADF